MLGAIQNFVGWRFGRQINIRRRLIWESAKIWNLLLALIRLRFFLWNLTDPFFEVRFFLQWIVDFLIELFLVEGLIQISFAWQFPAHKANQELLQKQFTFDFLSVTHRVSIDVEMEKRVNLLANLFILENQNHSGIEFSLFFIFQIVLLDLRDLSVQTSFSPWTGLKAIEQGEKLLFIFEWNHYIRFGLASIEQNQMFLM